MYGLSLRTYILYSDVHPLDGAFDVGQFLGAYVGVELCGLAALVAQQLLYVAEVCTTFEQMGGVAVAQPMEGGGFSYSAFGQYLVKAETDEHDLLAVVLARHECHTAPFNPERLSFCNRSCSFHAAKIARMLFESDVLGISRCLRCGAVLIRPVVAHLRAVFAHLRAIAFGFQGLVACC